MRVAVATVQVPFVRGGAEMLAENLCTALREAGHEAETVAIPFRWYPAETIPSQMLACRLLDLTESMGTRIDRLIGLKFPAYCIPHPAKVQWILHQHRGAYDLWGQPWGDLHHSPAGPAARDAIRAADAASIPQARRVYAISRTVAARLQAHSGIVAQPLHHPPPLARHYRSAASGDFLLMPSRINAIKRQDLVVQALARTRLPVRIVFAGAADDPAEAARLAAIAGDLVPGRTTWLGPVTDARKIELLSTALAVLVPPHDEDYGYVTLEAMLSARAVLTCTDSGGPLDFVQHGITGLVATPDPAALAAAMDQLWASRTRTRQMGEAGRERYAALGLDWRHVVQCLLA